MLAHFWASRAELAILGTFWDIFLDVLGYMLGRFGSYFGTFWIICWDVLGHILGRVGSYVGTFGLYFETFWVIF